ncbi:ABC transporter substrate-binding protein [Planobispora siamensis]|uniref:ABC transporter substrate-binding protein n=1 Tax=Planobispora siamensis TaxID=936338 RepID=UPI001EF2963F|nr:ABC transporter substrate-binding protein [Planobispora siamensis]
MREVTVRETTGPRVPARPVIRTAVSAALALVLALPLGGCRLTEEDDVLPAGACAGQQVTGISGDAIRVGGIYPLSGPASAYGLIASGARAYFGHVNEEGGVDGRKIEFVVRDDGYQPARAVEEARRLVELEEVFAIFQTVGTPSTAAVRDYADRRRVPQVFAATGASRWGTDWEHPWTIGYQPSYVAEARVYAQYLKETVPTATVAVLYQNDDFGRDLRDGFADAVRGSGVRIVAEQSYEVTDPGVQGQMANLAASGAEVLLSVTTPKFGAQALAVDAAVTSWNPLHIINSVAVAPAVMAGVDTGKVREIISAVYQKDAADPEWADDPAVAAYRASLRRYAPEADPAAQQAMFGWTAAQAFVQALKRMECPTREGLREAVRRLDEVSVDTLMPGITLSTGPGDGFPIESMMLARFAEGRWASFGEVVDTRAVFGPVRTAGSAG